MKNFRQYVGILLAGILLFFLVSPFVQTHNHLKESTFQIHWHFLIASFGLLLLYRTLYIAPFATLLGSLTQKTVSFQTAFTLFHLANITRYLPGRIWGIVRLLSLSARFGLSKIETASSLTLHVGIETALGGLIAMALLFSDGMQDIPETVLEKIAGETLLLTLAIMAVIAGFVFLLPKLAHHACEFLKTFTPLFKKSRLWVSILASHSMLWICQGIAFFFFVRSSVPVPWTDAGILTACFAFAWIVGFLSFLTPGGLGIREGLLGLLLANYMPASQATCLALLCRLWMLSAESLLAGTAFLFYRKTRCSENA